MMDYLPRDGLFTGVEYGKIDYHRLISSFEVATDGHLAINRSALYSLESMLISRYEMYKAVYFHKTVRSAEVMLLNSIMLADEQLNLTDTTLDNFLNLTDETTLEQICLLGNRNKSAVRLALEYKSRKLLKCVYERFLHTHGKLNKKLHVKALHDLESHISRIAKIKENTIFVDASSASSIPRTPTKEEISSIMLVEKEHEYEIPVSEMPLIASIAGSLDMLRVYTTAEKRNKIEELSKKVLDNEESLYWEELYGQQ
jgi:HD superfamily phosphohydrolase